MMVEVCVSIDEINKIRVFLAINNDKDAYDLLKMWKAAKRDDDILLLPVLNSDGSTGKLFINARNVICMMIQESVPEAIDVPHDSA